MKTTSEINNASYYIKKYEDGWNECYQKCLDEGCDDPGYYATMDFDETANAEQVVGYYFIHYEYNPLGGWLANTEGIEMSEQDKEVTKILKELCE